MSTAREAVKMVRILHGAFLISIPMYATVGELFAQTGAEPGKIIRGALIALSLMNVGIAQLFGRNMVKAAEAALAGNVADDAALGRWRQGHLLTFVLCESVAMFGLAFRLLGGDRLQAAPLYILAFALMLIWAPRPEFVRQV
jgi:hypothetical protein